MRTRRDPNPPRPPRMLTVRLVVVALMVGVVLAVGSAVVASVVWHSSPLAVRSPDFSAVFLCDGQAIIMQRHDYVGVNTWSTATTPRLDDETLRYFVEMGSARAVDAAPRPRDIRTPLDGRRGSTISYRFGWPMRAAHHNGRNASGSHASQWKGGYSVTAFGRDWTIPTLPLWPGLLGNTLFYALLVLTPLALLRWRKLRRRVKCGLCAACGYELGEGIGACPECGLAKRAS
ncbi:MAG: hypothetical protein NCW75_07920 [Phycisphaera sp.]|nr:MAG: hypothetical protein NCW75_07920 [Phycisphaera sp.]